MACHGVGQEVSGSIRLAQEAVERRKLDESLCCGVHRKEQAEQGKWVRHWLVQVISAGRSASQLSLVAWCPATCLVPRAPRADSDPKYEGSIKVMVRVGLYLG